MQPDDVVEQIERFAGYLRIRDEDGRVAPLFEGEDLDWTPDPAGIPDTPLPSAETAAMPAALPPLPGLSGAAPAGRFEAAPAAAMPALPVPAPGIAPPPQPSAELESPAVAGGGARLQLFVPPPQPPADVPFPGIEIEYEARGSILTGIAQSNQMQDRDAVLANPEAGVPAWADTDPETRLAELVAAAAEDAPAAAWMLREAASDPVALSELVAELAPERAGAGDGDGAAELLVSGEGVWVDGVLAAERPARPDPQEDREAATPPDAPDADALAEGDAAAGDDDAGPEGRNGLEDPGLEAELGSNRSEQAATIRDLNEVSGTVVVMGDVHDLSMIWQANLLSDADGIAAAFEGVLPEAGGNLASNVAWFEDAPALVAPGAASRPSEALRWEVDIVEGDLFDVNVLVQHHEIRDGDIAVQHHATGFSRLMLGGNEALSEAELTARADYYDVLVVGGGMVRANLIFQSNHLVDDDALPLLSTPGGDASVLPGGNLLWNDAHIRVSGEDVFAPLDAAGRAFHDALARGDETAETPFDLPVHAGGAGGTLRVLYVEGDYFDVNAISQTTVIHDVDAALQLGRGGTVLETGGNVSANAALIVDSRGQGEIAMAGGAHYDDDLLIQTNLIAEDTDMRIVDPDTLASELVAFLDPEQLPEPEDAGPFAGVLGDQASDMMGGVMA
jgi:hypothetical protein